GSLRFAPLDVGVPGFAQGGNVVAGRVVVFTIGERALLECQRAIELAEPSVSCAGVDQRSAEDRRPFEIAERQHMFETGHRFVPSPAQESDPAEVVPGMRLHEPIASRLSLAYDRAQRLFGLDRFTQ